MLSGEVNMSYNYCLLFVVVALLIPSIVLSYESPVETSATSEPWEIDVNLDSSIYLPTPRPIQDVYVVLNDTTPDLVYRVERASAEDPLILNKTIYSTVAETTHDTYKLTPQALGPFPKGEDLGFTLADWLAGRGEGTYIEKDGFASINLTFYDLVPGGRYSLWIHQVTMPPNYTYEFVPLGAADGSENTFLADLFGNATFYIEMEPLPPTTEITFEDFVAMYVSRKAPIEENITWTLLSAIYHSDGETHGSTPGMLGKDAHVQLVHLIYPKPAKDYQEWMNASSSLPAEQGRSENGNKASPGLPGIVAIAGALAIALLMRGKRH